MLVPFFLLLVLIALGPIIFEHFWHKNYKAISLFLGGLVIIIYLYQKENFEITRTFAEYFSFISLLFSLYILSCGIYIFSEKKATPLINSIFLFLAAIITNFIGTTGAAVLLIRPYIRLNRYHIKPYHIIFFIFIVCNIGGMLTPLGDPPLFLGYLKGLPFFWNIKHTLHIWLFSVIFLVFIFFLLDHSAAKKREFNESSLSDNNKFIVKGKRNFLGLIIILAALFLDPHIFTFIPTIKIHGAEISFVRELIILLTASCFYFFANKKALAANNFSFEPILEIIFIFFGLFFTMMPALTLVQHLAANPIYQEYLTKDTLYWATGFCSSILDNAPTYLNFLTAAMAKNNLNINELSDVTIFINSNANQFILIAISVAAVIFGAFTYIGNGPNFLIKAIAEKEGIKMPSFFGYIIKYSLIYLLPLFFIIWLLFIFKL
ncbi:MAG: sodium:proton antiporter [Candidatus Margulisiibacteriota bacterium]|jgi:Na+/H+ antiporter NhaD/arsenite permease-like protein